MRRGKFQTPALDDITDMNEAAPNAYDEFPYDTLVYPQSEPDRLATQAALFGMESAPPDRCRVLELGCASGGNLLPQAANFPRSRYVGIDHSGRQIANASDDARALQLQNIEFRQTSIADIDVGIGEFDYIIAQGVYSWVAADIRDKLMNVCNRNLASNGVAYVSYNAYPGWHIHSMIRESMRYHVDRFPDLSVKARHARSFLRFLEEVMASQHDVLSAMLHRELSALAHKDDFYLLHDHLEEDNVPVYFHQFIQHAKKHGLQYLSEAQFHLMPPKELAEQLSAKLDGTALDTIHLEQYYDFMRTCRFRQTLLVHDDVTVRRPPSWETLRNLRIASDARPVSMAHNLRSCATDEFRTSEQASIGATQPITKVVLVVLSEAWPRFVPFSELCARAVSRLRALKHYDASSTPNIERTIGLFLLDAYGQAVVQLRTISPPFVTELSDRPTASAIARLQARRRTTITNSLHARVTLEPLGRFVLQHLDGLHGRGDLETALRNAIRRGDLAIPRNGQRMALEQALRAVPEVVQDCLRFFASAALLVA